MTRSTHPEADEHQSPPSVVAVVVTFDAPEALQDCVSALLAQTARVHEMVVVDNHSAEAPTLALMPPEAFGRVRIVRLPENAGPAGGFARGLGEIMQSEHSYAWAMDDDVVPAFDCLEHLLAEMADLGGHAVLFPRQINTRNDSAVEHWGWNGALIPTPAIRAAGVPLGELFWGMEDTEYFRDRLPLAGYPLRRATQATVRLAIRAPDARRPAWKYYYECRNLTYFYLYLRPHIAAITRVKSLIFRLAGEVNRVRRVEDGKLRKTRAILLGVFHGLTKRLGRRVEPDSADRAWSRRPG